MKLEDCYRSLGLKPGASREQVKQAYRVLARQHHPDTTAHQSTVHKNTSNQNTSDIFLTITIAYKYLLAHTALSPAPNPASTAFPKTPENLLKYNAYARLRDLFAQQRFASAIALVEALTSKLPDDLEVQQWCAIAYQQQGRRLMRDRRYPQALRYLQKALATNPTNRDLVAKLHQDLRSLTRQVQQASLRSI
ncbi:MAG: J domain-containing protein [Alkalinema sp. CAN_BIN05]|nr:J domain-containing protein [Alkalinema sp. CAN_BIN05]